MLNEATGVVPNAFTYLSQPLNPSLKLHNFQARSYSAREGRFLSEDPVSSITGVPLTLNKCQYGFNNPLKYSDVTGNYPE